MTAHNETSAAAKAERERRKAVEDTRRAMVTLGEEIHDLIDGLDSENVEVLGLQVRMVARGAPLPGSTRLRIESPQAAIPDDDGVELDTRPGATALYLEALGDGGDRWYVEVRSNPGLAVQVLSNLDRVRLETGTINAIGIDWGDAFLGTYSPPTGVLDKRLKAQDLLNLFLQDLHFSLDRAAKYNRGVL